MSRLHYPIANSVGRVLSVVSCALVVSLGQGTGAAAQVPEPPPTPVRVVHDTLHGVFIEDPYRWLENVEDPEVIEWMRAQDAYARAVLERIPGRRDVAAEIQALYRAAGGVRDLQRDGDLYFYLKRSPGDAVAKLYVREGLGGRDRLLLDPDKLRRGSRRLTIETYKVSTDGRHVLYGVAADGAEILSIGVVETSTGRRMSRSSGAVSRTGFRSRITTYPELSSLRSRTTPSPSSTGSRTRSESMPRPFPRFLDRERRGARWPIRTIKSLTPSFAEVTSI
jgi:hypothetical protein